MEGIKAAISRDLSGDGGGIRLRSERSDSIDGKKAGRKATKGGEEDGCTKHVIT